MDKLNQIIYDYTGFEQATQEKIFLTVAIIVILAVFRVMVHQMVWKRTQDVKTRYQWKRIVSFLVPFVGTLLIAIVWASAFHQFGAFLGLITAGVAIALKDPLTNIAGWMFILFRKPFSLGDRVQVGEHKGDIVDIRLFQFTMLEVGNWVQAEQSTGRIIHLPNGKVFQEAQANYSSGFEYIWDEMPVLITFESNWEKAKKMLESVVNQCAEKVDGKTKDELLEASKHYMIYYKHLTPIVYTSVEASGVLLTIRYLCHPQKRRGTQNDMWQNILIQINASPDIDLAYPTTRFYRDTNGDA